MQLEKTDRILRLPEVLTVVGLSKTTLWRRIRSGEFPAPVKLGGDDSRAVGWLSSDIERWLTQRQAA